MMGRGTVLHEAASKTIAEWAMIELQQELFIGAGLFMLGTPRYFGG